MSIEHTADITLVTIIEINIRNHSLKASVPVIYLDHSWNNRSLCPVSAVDLDLCSQESELGFVQ
jgi:hypothetical protein